MPSDDESLRRELNGARETIDHMSQAMAWISGHDRTGADHLEEMMQASRERDAAEAKLREIQKYIDNADWQGFAETPQEFNNFCAHILLIIDIDSLGS